MQVGNIISLVAEKLDVPIFQLLSKSRERGVQDAAKIATYLVRHNHRMLSLKQIGRFMRREDIEPLDHSTVINRLKKHDDLMCTDKDYRYKFNKIKMEELTIKQAKDHIAASYGFKQWDFETIKQTLNTAQIERMIDELIVLNNNIAIKDL